MLFWVVISVVTKPGATAFTSTPAAAELDRHARVSPLRPVLLTMYGRRRSRATTVQTELTLTMRP